jgi:Iap family predicted aminopeptidase
MRWRFFIFCCLVPSAFFAQEPDISVKEVSRIINVLASDSLKGRGNYTNDLFKAAHFIAEEFAKDSLLPFEDAASYLHAFSEESNQENWIDADSNLIPGNVLLNVVGMLKGRSKPEEMIIFSAHYDHLGYIKKKKRGDSIYNGANDNASGTTAVLALAHYFAQRADNERTLVFCAFSGEELGLKGSKLFSEMADPAKIIAVLNIEMIGRCDFAGRNAFFVTGADYSGLKDILKKNLKGSPVKIVREPREDKMLFQRSDNLHFALQGIPAHSIMCSDDTERCYHSPCDELERMDLENMTRIIRAIAKASRTLVDGSEQLSRITRRIDSPF